MSAQPAVRASPASAWLAARGRNTQHVLTRPWVLWALAAVFWARLAFLTLVTPGPPDGAALIAAARDFLHSPRHLYEAEAAFLRLHGLMPSHGWSGPPGAMFLVAPFALLPDPIALRAWMLGDLAGAAASGRR